jgi:predicted RNase H-like HicB family nuclease
VRVEGGDGGLDSDIEMVMATRKVTVVLFPGEEPGYVAFLPLFPGCTTQGDTPQEAFDAAKESLELLLEEAAEDDLEALDISQAEHVILGELEVERPHTAAK